MPVPLSVMLPRRAAGAALATGTGPEASARFPLRRKLQFLAALIVLAVAGAGLVLVRTLRDTDRLLRWGIVKELKAEYERIAFAGQQMLFIRSGATEEPVKVVVASRDAIDGLLTALLEGGSWEGRKVPAMTGRLSAPLETLQQAWTGLRPALQAVLDNQDVVRVVNSSLTTVRTLNEALYDQSGLLLAELQRRRSGEHAVRLNEFRLLHLRITGQLEKLAEPSIAQPITEHTLSGLLQTAEAALGSALPPGAAGQELKPAHDQLARLFQDYRVAATALVQQAAVLPGLFEAFLELSTHGEQAMGAAVDQLLTALEEARGHTGRAMLALAGLAAIVVLALALMGKLSLDESRRGASRSAAENRDNQQAILRLMDEMAALASGDLTARATVTEDFTGAIADAINYTADELASLVKRIDLASVQVAEFTETAKHTADELLGATQKQGEDIYQTGMSINQLSSAVTQVAENARTCAAVARESLDASSRGAEAVRNSIAHMNHIRNQIQETSKLIKRLGEGSQEIGEIVDLISGITEQTNVLALNAAIQASSAGAAGRGFSILAEEVQRLAERSGEATRQIATLVESIQTDTQQAVAAMEKSTRSVVEGTGLSDAAGQALARIETISQQLAAQIETISGATAQQQEAVQTLNARMGEILSITDLTTQRVLVTVGQMGELNTLAQDLRQSISGFKV